MRKYCRVFIIPLIMIMLTGCSVYNNYSGCGEYSKVDVSDKYADVIAITEYTEKQYNSGKLQLGRVIWRKNLDSFEEDEKISEIFSGDYYFYKSDMHDEDTVIIQRDVIFQSVIGYIATKKDALDTVPDEIYKYPRLNISPSLGYDENAVWVESYLGDFEEWHLYRYNAGL